MRKRVAWSLAAGIAASVAVLVLNFTVWTPENALKRELTDRRDTLAAVKNALVAKNTPPNGIFGFFVRTPNFEIHGRGLARVEVWMTFWDNRLRADKPQKLGEAAKYDETAGEQIWLFAIPKDPLAAEELFVKGFDAAGKEIAKYSLAVSGRAEIKRVLWGDN